MLQSEFGQYLFCINLTKTIESIGKICYSYSNIKILWEVIMNIHIGPFPEVNYVKGDEVIILLIGNQFIMGKRELLKEKVILEVYM